MKNISSIENFVVYILNKMRATGTIETKYHAPIAVSSNLLLQLNFTNIDRLENR